MTDWGDIWRMLAASAATLLTAAAAWLTNKQVRGSKGTSVPETPANGQTENAVFKWLREWSAAFEKRLDERLVREFGELWKANEKVEERVGTVEKLAAVVDDRTKPGGRS